MATLQISTSFDDRDAQFMLSAFTIATGKTLLDACKTAGRIAARSFGEKTWPKTQASGEGAVLTQVRRVYATMSDAYQAIQDANGKDKADAFWAAVYGSKRRNWKQAKIILSKYGGKMSGVPVMPFDGGAAHDQERRKNARGRIPKLKNFRMIVQNEGIGKATGMTKLNAYIKRKQANVGFTQSAWYNCLKALGGVNKRTKRDGDFGADTITTPFPTWVTRHKRFKMGTVTESQTEDRSGIVMHSAVPWAATALEAGAERYIMARSREHLMKYMRISIAMAIKSAKKTA